MQVLAVARNLPAWWSSEIISPALFTSSSSRPATKTPLFASSRMAMVGRASVDEEARVSERAWGEWGGHGEVRGTGKWGDGDKRTTVKRGQRSGVRLVSVWGTK